MARSLAFSILFVIGFGSSVSYSNKLKINSLNSCFETVEPKETQEIENSLISSGYKIKSRIESNHYVGIEVTKTEPPIEIKEFLAKVEKIVGSKDIKKLMDLGPTDLYGAGPEKDSNSYVKRKSCIFFKAEKWWREVKRSQEEINKKCKHRLKEAKKNLWRKLEIVLNQNFQKIHYDPWWNAPPFWRPVYKITRDRCGYLATEKTGIIHKSINLYKSKNKASKPVKVAKHSFLLFEDPYSFDSLLNAKDQEFLKVVGPGSLHGYANVKDLKEGILPEKFELIILKDANNELGLYIQSGLDPMW